MSFAAEILRELWATLCDMAPWLIFGFFASGILSVFISPDTVKEHLGGRGIWPVIKASLFGVPLPLCSCGVIPVTASLRRHGATKGAATSFMLSTPQTGVDSIMVTFSLLGPVFAVFRPVAAFLTGVLGGSIVEYSGIGEDIAEEDEECTGSCCSGGEKKSRLARALDYGFTTLAADIARPLLVGLVVAGLIGAAVPDNFFADTVGSGFLSMLVMMLFGIPLYVCATASIPIAAAMMLKGVTPGAALVFLMTGPATNAAAIATIWKVLGHKTAVAYLTIVAVSALAAGFALDLIFDLGEFVPGKVSMWMMPEWAKAIFAILLLVVLVRSLLKSSSHSH
jgi:uncharacterized membrane protein YraQ (UPF0718 family)